MSWNWNPDNNPSNVRCSRALDALWYCYTPGHQFKRLYVVGEPDSCRREFGEFISCLRVKLKKRADAIEFLDERFPEKKKGATSSASETIWNMRRQPPFPFEQTTQNEQRGNTVELVVEEDG